MINKKPLVFYVSLDFFEKVSLSKRKEIVEKMKDSLEKLIRDDEDIPSTLRATVECPDTSQQLEIEIIPF